MASGCRCRRAPLRPLAKCSPCSTNTHYSNMQCRRCRPRGLGPSSPGSGRGTQQVGEAAGRFEPQIVTFICPLVKGIVGVCWPLLLAAGRIVLAAA